MHRNNSTARKHTLTAYGISQGWSWDRMMVIMVVKQRKERLISSYLLLYLMGGLGLETTFCSAFASMRLCLTFESMSIGSTTIPKSKDNMAEAHSDRIVTDWKARFYCRRADIINLLNSLHPD
ncbi:hypothetical protein AAC387_Pa11g1985 [Persea americana]